MSDILFKLLNEDAHDGDCLFNRFKNRLFKDYSQGKKILKKNDLWVPLNEITKELYGSKLDREGFNNIYSELDTNSKGFITKKQFGTVARCLIMSLITYFEKKYPIPGREISLCLEESDLPVQIKKIRNSINSQYSKNNSKRKRKNNKNNKNANKNNNNTNNTNGLFVTPATKNSIENDTSKTNIAYEKFKNLLIDIDSEDF